MTEHKYIWQKAFQNFRARTLVLADLPTDWSNNEICFCKMWLLIGKNKSSEPVFHGVKLVPDKFLSKNMEYQMYWVHCTYAANRDQAIFNFTSDSATINLPMLPSKKAKPDNYLEICPLCSSLPAHHPCCARRYKDDNNASHTKAQWEWQAFICPNKLKTTRKEWAD